MCDIITADMGDVMEQARRLATLDTNILLEGETGTGKTRLAPLIHEMSPRRAEPFRAINCGALAADLIDRDLFGRVDGAVAGANQARMGKFAAAGRGTVFLDEIDALPLALQAKLLRAVEERQFEPIGGDDSMTIEARLIAASNRPLEGEVEAGRFRAALYYRLNEVRLYLPPLREQPERISALANRLLKDCASRYGRPVRSIGNETLRILLAYRWPGNIRELHNIIERAVALCSSQEIRADDLPPAIRSAASHCVDRLGQEPACRHSLRGMRLNQAVKQAERLRLRAALKEHDNNFTRAAKTLGISRSTLYKKLAQYGLRVSRSG
jgi:two-component system, NtrC family, response regulator AtoC